jgi:DNA (cytosine-5)-methyltransferase 1
VIYIDLFAGAGGLSEGFMRAGGEAVAHIEMNQDAVNTIKTRLCYYHLRANNQLDIYYNYLRGEIDRDQLYALVPEGVINSALCYTMSEQNINEIFAHIDRLINVRGGDEVDIIVGGPPCQAYSLVGRSIKSAQDKQRIKNAEEVQDDPRNYLYKLYCEFLKKYKPKLFVFENVTGLLTAQNGKFFNDLFKLADECGYVVDHRTLKAEEYGVLQSRRRVIVIGWRKDLDFKYPDINKRKLNTTVSEMLADLPKLKPGESSSNYIIGGFSSYLLETGIREAGDVLTWHIARPHIDRDREIYKHVINRWKDGHKRLKYDDLPEELKTHKNRKAFVDRFKIVEGDTSTCHTMMAHISKDGHYFIHPDIKQARSISVREAARIQSFPDNYFFEGSRTAAFTQIGNAVPPLMAEAIAVGIKSILNRKREEE